MSAIFVDMAKASYKNDYCAGQNYVTSGANYPHLHCADNLLLLSYRRQQIVDHVQFAEGNNIYCPRVIRVLNDPVHYGSFHTNPTLRDAIMNFANDNCQKGMDDDFDKKNYNKLIKNKSIKKKSKKKNKMSNNKKLKKKLMKYNKKHKKANKRKVRDEH